MLSDICRFQQLDDTLLGDDLVTGGIGGPGASSAAMSAHMWLAIEIQIKIADSNSGGPIKFYS